MRLKNFLFLIMVFITITANAQNYQEVVYLKNGSAIRGVVIEQTPNESLKIQTSDGSIYVYQMDDVEKIVKEATTGKTSSTNKGSRTTKAVDKVSSTLSKNKEVH